MTALKLITFATLAVAYITGVSILAYAVIRFLTRKAPQPDQDQGGADVSADGERFIFHRERL